MPAGFRRHLVGKTLRNVFHCDIAEIRFAGKLVIIQTFSLDNSSPLNSTHYAKLYPQNGDHVVATDSATSFHPVY